MTVSIRGAITVEANEKELIYEAASKMMKEIIDANNINIDDIVSIMFTATNDLDKAYPAVAIRQMGITGAAFMCVQEMYVEGSLRKCIRVMVTVEGNYDRKNIKHAYLKGASVLRPDLKR